MRDLEGLRLTIEGVYNDAFLYGSDLYLVSDETLEIVNFPRLLKTFLPDAPDKQVLYKYAFLKNDAFYDQGNLLYDFFSIKYIRNFLLQAYAEAQHIQIARSELRRALRASLPHGHPGVLHLEVYRHSLFLSADGGTFAYRIIDAGRLSPTTKLLDFPAVHMSANVGSLVYLSCGHNGLVVGEFDGVQKRGKPSLEGWHQYEEKAISTELAYYDFVCREVGNEYTYRLNSLRGITTKPKEHTPDERVNAFENVVVTDDLDQPVLTGADFVSAYNDRLLRLRGREIAIYGMDYQQRMAVVDQHEDPHFYKAQQAVSLPSTVDIGEILSGFQTVFGLVLDTEKGTIVLDDDPTGDTPIRARLISDGENVKLRHYYRSRNYSHLVLSIKDKSLDVFADLTNYFFPKRKKHLRILRPFGSRSSGEVFNFSPFASDDGVPPEVP